MCSQLFEALQHMYGIYKCNKPANQIDHRSKNKATRGKHYTQTAYYPAVYPMYSSEKVRKLKRIFKTSQNKEDKNIRFRYTRIYLFPFFFFLKHNYFFVCFLLRSYHRRISCNTQSLNCAQTFHRFRFLAFKWLTKKANVLRPFIISHP